MKKQNGQIGLAELKNACFMAQVVFYIGLLVCKKELPIKPIIYLKI